MGKNDSVEVPTVPDFTPSTIKYGDTVIAQTYKDANGNVVTEYLQSEEDKALKEWRQSQISELEPNINVFSDELLQQWEDIATAKENQSVEQFNALWDPIAKSTREDLWSRGLADSSIAADVQKNQDEVKADALESIANDYTAELQDLENNELSNRYAYLYYLNDGLENMTQDAFTAMTTGLLSSNTTNSNNIDTWKTLLNQYNYEQSNSSGSSWFYPLF